MNFLDSITDWPVLAQAVAGSALTAVLWWLGKMLARGTGAVLESQDRKLRKARIQENLLRLRAAQAVTSIDQATYATLLIYRALRNITKALIMLTLGLGLGTLAPALGAVGCVFSLLYFFRALNALTPEDPSVNIPYVIDAVERELERLKDA